MLPVHHPIPSVFSYSKLTIYDDDRFARVVEYQYFVLYPTNEHRWLLHHYHHPAVIHDCYSFFFVDQHCPHHPPQISMIPVPSIIFPIPFANYYYCSTSYDGDDDGTIVMTYPKIDSIVICDDNTNLMLCSNCVRV